MLLLHISKIYENEINNTFIKSAIFTNKSPMHERADQSKQIQIPNFTKQDY